MFRKLRDVEVESEKMKFVFVDFSYAKKFF